MLKGIRYLFFAALLMGLTACGGEKALTEEEVNSYKAKGKTVAEATFKALSTELKASMEAKGVPGALSYCNVKAYPITDSMSALHDAKIRRVALRYRNPQNAPDDSEKQVLEAYQKDMQAGKALSPQVVKIDGEEIRFYAPILLKPLCVNCHGTPGETMTEDNLQKIRKLYPEDQAINFAPGDLRGMWSIAFHPEN